MDPEIYDPHFHIALEASAGTGKTYNLTLRLLHLLLGQISSSITNPEELRKVFQEIVALTFTNKAAQEMKERLLKWLKDCITLGKNSKNSDIVNILPPQIEPKQLQKKALVIYQALLNDFSALEIGTLDSFFSSIIRLFPFETGVGLDVEIADEAKEKIMFEEALDRLFTEINEDKNLKKGILEIYRLGLARRDYNVRAWLKDFFSTCLIHHQEIEETYFENLSLDLSDLKETERVFAAIECFIKTLTPHLKHKGAQQEIEKLKQAKERKNIKEIFKINFLSKSSLNDHGYFKNLPPDCESSFEKLRQTIMEYVEQGNKWQVGLLLRLYHRFYHCFETIKKRENCITFSDLAGLTYNLLVKDGLLARNKEFFYYRLDKRVKHLLLDEFQDTSVIQWQVLEPLVNELIAGIGTRDTAGSFFYVGDKKQAIYRFRGGEVGLFDYVKRRFSGWITEKTLPINFRSAAGLINFVNIVFKDLAENEKFPFYPQKPSEENQDSPFYIELSLLSPDDDQHSYLGEFISKKIQQLKRAGLSYKDIAILVRKSSTTDKFLPILKAKNIPCGTETQVQLVLAPAARTVLALLHFLDDPQQEIELFTFLKAINLSPKEIHRLALSKRPLLSALPAAIEEKVKQIWQKVDLVPLPQLLKEIYEIFNLFSIYPDRENLLALLDIAYEFEKNNIRSLREFLNYVNEKKEYLSQAKEAMADAVQIMTIHKAKGLEFEAVILPEMGYDCLKNKDKLIFKYSPESMKLEGIYIKPDKNEAALSPTLKEVKAYAEETHLRDELNLFYVASTRAKSILMMIGQPSKNYRLPRNCWLNYVVRALRKKLDLNTLKNISEICLEREGEILPRTKPPQKPSYYFQSTFEISHLQRPFKTETPELIVLNHPQLEQVFGEAFHYVMSWLRSKKDNVKKAINRAREKYGLYLTKTDFEDIENRALRVLNCPDLQPYFFSKNKVLTECPLLFIQDKIQSYRPDRVVLLKDKIVVLDYKTQLNPEREQEYIQQVRQYQTILRKIFPNYHCEAYLVYVLKNKIYVEQV